MKKIQTCLWFNNCAEEAARFYTSVFKNARLGPIIQYGRAAAEASGQQEGSVMAVGFEIECTSFLGLNGGPHFKFDPSISLFVGCNSEREISELWQNLAKEIRMPLNKYPFAEKYGWCVDRFGVNWQLILSSSARSSKISPALLFANRSYGRAEEAIHFYVSNFPDSKVEMIAHDEKTKAVLHASFMVANQGFVAMEGPLPAQFGFSPAVSFMIPCESQDEVDGIWQKLSAVPEAEQCGWLRDRFGISWQVIHKDWTKMLGETDPIGHERLMSAIIGMKKPDLAVLDRAYRG